MGDLPFTIEQFLNVFRDYNRAIWPVHVLAYAVGAVTLFCAVRGGRRCSRIVAVILGVLWIWMGVVYHVLFFAPVNPAAYLFGGLFVVQGMLFLWAARKGLAFSRSSRWSTAAGSALVLYATVVYPLLGMLLGHGWPAAPMFGVAPCPTTIFTFGILLWSATRVPIGLLVIPALWSVIGSTAALKLGIREDVGLLVAAVLAIGLLLSRRRGSHQDRP